MRFVRIFLLRLVGDTIKFPTPGTPSPVPDPILATRRGGEGGSRRICMRMRQLVQSKRLRLTSGRRENPYTC